MVRAAAKNHASVAVVTDPAAYPALLAALGDGGFTLAQRRALAGPRVRATSPSTTWRWPSWCAQELGPGGRLVAGVRRAGAAAGRRRCATARTRTRRRPSTPTRPSPAGLAQAEQLHGKEMSYNNYVDADAAWRAANDFADQPAVAIIKHANPCGIAVGADVAEAHRKAHACDPVSRVRRRDRGQPRRSPSSWPGRSPRSSPRCVVAPGVRRRARSRCSRARRTSGCCGPRPGRRLPAEWRQVTGGVLVQLRRPDGRRRATTRPNWRLATGEAGRRGDPARTSRSPGGRSAR